MRKPILTAAILLLAFTSVTYSQSSKDYFQLLKKERIALSNTALLNSQLPFKMIEVVDARQDTSKLGFVRKGYNFKRLVTKESASQDLSAFLNNGLQTSFDKKSNTALLVVIKTLWLQELEEIRYKDERGFGSKCTAVLDVYAKKSDEYVPLFKLDTNVYHPANLASSATTLITAVIKSCLKKVILISSNNLIHSAKKVSIQEVKVYNEKRYNAPLFKQTSLPCGVFVSFADFLNNTPATRPFRANFNNLIDELYWTDKVDENRIENFWGFCDGEQYYIKLGSNFYPLYKDGLTFNLWGNETKTGHRNPLWMGTANTDISAKSSRRNRYNHPLQVNMETGKVF